MSREDLVSRIEIKDKSGKVVGTKEVVRYAGLLSRAHEEGLKRIETKLVQLPTEENGMVAVASAVIETEKGTFTATSDATMGNTNPRMHKFLTALAETRAKARALRDAVNAGMISVEDLLGENGNSGLLEAHGETREPSPDASELFPPNDEGKVLSPTGSQMSEAQRGYLFRLLAEQGVAEENAHDVLLERLKAVSMSEVTKTRASQLIEELLAEPSA